MRKPISVALCESGAMAVCDDGSIWGYDEDHTWTRLSDIPQDKPERDLQSNAPHSLRFLRTEYRWGLEGHQSGWHLSVGDVGALLDVVTAAQRVVARHDAGERPINVEELRLKLSALEQEEPR